MSLKALCFDSQLKLSPTVGVRSYHGTHLNILVLLLVDFGWETNVICKNIICIYVYMYTIDAQFVRTGYTYFMEVCTYFILCHSDWVLQRYAYFWHAS
jgi:hypothetical protein